MPCSSDRTFDSRVLLSSVRESATSGSFLGLMQLLLERLPVRVELGEARIGERVLHELGEDVVWQRRDVGTCERRVDDVHRVTERGGEHLGLVSLDVVD